MVLCDLPYGVTSCEWDTKPDLERLWKEYRRITKPTAAIVLFGTQPFTTDLVNSARDIFRYEYIWKKSKGTNFQLAFKNPLKMHENILVFYRKMPVFNQVNGEKCHEKTYRDIGGVKMAHLQNKDTDHRRELKNLNKSLLEYGSEHNPEYHATQKPIDLCVWLIRAYTNKGDIVLDNTCGAGTILVAAKLTGRRSIGVESELKYCELAVKERLNRPLPLFDEAGSYDNQMAF